MELAHVKREFNSPADFLASKALQGNNVHVRDAEGLQQLRDLNKLQRSAVQQNDSTRAEINAEPETDQQESAPSSDVHDDSAEADSSDDNSAHHSESRQHGAHDAAHLADAQDEAEVFVATRSQSRRRTRSGADFLASKALQGDNVHVSDVEGLQQLRDLNKLQRSAVQQSDSTRAEINAEPETNQQESAPSCDARDDSAEADGSDDSSAHHSESRQHGAHDAAHLADAQDEAEVFHKQYKRRVAQKVGVSQREVAPVKGPYRPQANGQQERSVQTVIRCVRAYVESPDQDDWEDAVYRLMFAINTSVDAVRRETPFFLVHGWDAKTTVSAMLAREPQGRDKLDAYLWRLQVQRQHEYAIELAKQLQREAKEQRANERNENWASLPEKHKSGLEVGNAVWLYYPRVKPGLARKLAHAWHGPFRIAEKSDDYRVKLSVAGTPYRISPWVHVSRLKPRVIDDKRPAPTCIGELPEHDDWDAALLPEDSWLADESAGEYEVERIVDVRWVASRTRTQARRREYLVQWAGYEGPTWVPATQLNCGRLLHEFDVSAKAKSRFAAVQASDESGEQA
ncbi:hypothetical protein P43SY_009842 [Pythium insidiosum]|uniref:Chromo domain-containing protein n=1 Tax=Pythium insidiosum TaxID=114742 RepID=A0AAD5L7X9_PYTIN|nr:hypothetical protein P43SY_009842 [Pythium insidiosum]